MSLRVPTIKWFNQWFNQSHAVSRSDAIVYISGWFYKVIHIKLRVILSCCNVKVLTVKWRKIWISSTKVLHYLFKYIFEWAFKPNDSVTTRLRQFCQLALKLSLLPCLTAVWQLYLSDSSFTCPFSLSGIPTTAASTMLLDPKSLDSRMDGATSYIQKWICWIKISKSKILSFVKVWNWIDGLGSGWMYRNVKDWLQD